MKQKMMLVDGYNMIAFWQETKQAFKANQLDEARNLLLQKLNNYANFEGIDITCVFDAQYVPGSRQRYDQYKVEVVFTEENETADDYIERMAAELNTSLHLVEVATSDLNEQWTIFAQGCLRLSARELEQRVNTVKSDLKQMTNHIDLHTPRLSAIKDDQMEKLRALMSEID